MDKQFNENIRIMSSLQKEGFKVEILEYKELKGSTDHRIAQSIYHIQRAGMKMKQIKVNLENSGVIIKPGSLYFHKGNINTNSNFGGISGFAKKMIKNSLTEGNSFNPLYSGTGELYLEPSFSHFIITELNDDSIIVEKGLFYCCQQNIEVGFSMQKTISSALRSEEGLFQTRIKGTGICVLEIPVPVNEVLKIDLNNEKLQVDGNFVLLRSESVRYSYGGTSGGFVGKLTSEEGILQTFEGTGTVWLAPTQPVYKYILTHRLNELTKSKPNINDAV